MNIAILLPALGGGGAERVASLIGNYYSDKGHNVYYFLGDYGFRKRYDVKGKVINSDIQFLVGHSWIFNLIESAGKIRKLKRQYKIDVAISFMEEFNYLNILSKGREKVIIRVCRILSVNPNHVKSFFLNPYVLGFTYNMADRVIVMSDYAIDDMNKVYKVRKKRLCKIPNPVSKIEQGMENDGQWEFGDKVIVHVGRFVNEKQQNVAIKAFSVVCQKDKEAQLVLLGDGYNRKKIEGMINRTGLRDRIHVLGFRDNVYYYLKHSRVFLMTSKTEGFPNAMLEAINAGLPIISTDAPGGAAEILGKTKASEMYCRYGVVTPYIWDDDYNTKNIAQEERELGIALFNMLNDNELYRKYHNLSLKRAKMYQLENIMKRWDKLILA